MSKFIGTILEERKEVLVKKYLAKSYDDIIAYYAGTVQNIQGSV